VYEAKRRNQGDGARVLIDRLWPRGVSKASLEIDRWLREVAPSSELRRWYGHRAERFDEFATRYLRELRHAPASHALDELRVMGTRRPLTLLTATRDVERSAAAVLAALLQQERQKSSAPSRPKPPSRTSSSQPNKARRELKDAMTAKTDDREPEERFERLAAWFLGDPKVSGGTGFGKTQGLRVEGKIFAMLAGRDLVVKLPRERVDQLVESGTGARFDPRRDGRVMKEWVTISIRHGGDWEQLAEEAFRFVGSPTTRSRRR
jgi:uncharacterized protein YeaO (DUF488 family)